MVAQIMETKADYSDLVEEAKIAFTTDPNYLADMAYAANRVIQKRIKRAGRTLASVPKGEE